MIQFFLGGVDYQVRDLGDPPPIKGDYGLEFVGKHPVGTKPDGKHGGRKLTKPPAEQKNEKDYERCVQVGASRRCHLVDTGKFLNPVCKRGGGWRPENLLTNGSSVGK